MIACLARYGLAVAAICCCLPQVSDGQTQDAPTLKRRTGPPPYVREMRYLDIDGDRQISAKELAAGQQMASMMLMLSWDACDRDGDGAISLEELQPAADEAMQTLLETDSESEQKAEEELARLMPLRLLLERLAENEEYSAELAALRAAIEGLDDDDAIITHITTYPRRYPHIAPIVRTWYRYYPVRPGLRRHLRPLPPRHDPPGPKVKPGPRPKPKAGRPGPRKPPKPGGKPKPKPRPKPKPKP